VSLHTRGSCSAFTRTTEAAFKASRDSLERHLFLLAAEFRGQVAASLEEMNAYMRVLMQSDRYMRADIELLSPRDKIEEQNVEYTECITAQAFADAAREWNTQRVSIRSKE
jgi:hypothetical protein